MNFHDFHGCNPHLCCKDAHLWKKTAGHESSWQSHRRKGSGSIETFARRTTLLVVSHRLVTGWWFKFAGNQTTAKTQRFSPQQLVGGFISFLRSTFKKCDDDHHWEQLTLLYLEVEVWISTPMTSDLRNIYLHFYRNHQIFRRKTKSFAIFFSPTGWVFQFSTRSTGGL